MPSENEIVKLLSQLTKLTVKGDLYWRRRDPPDFFTDGTNDKYPEYFQTDFRDQLIGVGLKRFQLYDGDRDRLYWGERMILVFVDGFGRVLWEYDEQSSALVNLYQKVRETVADVSGILKNLLADEDDL